MITGAQKVKPHPTNAVPLGTPVSSQRSAGLGEILQWHPAESPVAPHDPTAFGYRSCSRLRG